MFLIIGLGNPEKKYARTRHNAGFLAMDFLAKESKWLETKKLKSSIAETELNGQKIILAKPQTYMNNSGLAVAALVKKYNLPAENIIVVYDELDLPFENIRVKLGGSSAGHNGIKSIIEHLGTDKFWRLRIGISNNDREIIPAEKFVLSKFSQEELKTLQEKILPEAMAELEKIIR